jgi:hypothetical protein
MKNAYSALTPTLSRCVAGEGVCGTPILEAMMMKGAGMARGRAVRK